MAGGSGVWTCAWCVGTASGWAAGGVRGIRTGP
nr:MAG TPA: hypothetical protein [Caudoviricetes sp.]